MPQKDPDARRAYQREYHRKRRARLRSAAAARENGDLFTGAAAVDVAPVDDPAQALARWCEDSLVVPPGHPLSGQAMRLPAFGRRWFSDTLTPGVQESLLCVARKNAKSALLAAYLLCRLVGPLRFDGYRAGIVSISKEKAGELKMQMQAIAQASRLEGLTFYRSPAPGRIESKTGRVDILAADAGAGHASGFDDALIDELGLLAEKHRSLVHGMRSSRSSRGGRFLAISIQGDAPFTAEMIERHPAPGLVVHQYQADEDAALDDPAQWRQANPGIDEGIKSLDYMRAEAARVLATPADQGLFKAHDLNIAQDPGREMICSLADWQACEVPADELPPRQGGCVVGVDLGGSSSMTAAVALWQSGRVEAWGAFPGTPDLAARGAADGVGDLYQRMHARGELTVYAGRVTPAGQFLRDVAERLAGTRVIRAGADRYRRAEAIQAVESAGLRWRMVWRGQGAHAVADGSHDVRAFQRRVLTRTFRSAPSLLMTHAIRESSIRRDQTGNPALGKGRTRGRIDALSAAVIAAGLVDVAAAARTRRRRHGLAG